MTSIPDHIKTPGLQKSRFATEMPCLFCLVSLMLPDLQTRTADLLAAWLCQLKLCQATSECQCTPLLRPWCTSAWRLPCPTVFSSGVHSGVGARAPPRAAYYLKASRISCHAFSAASALSPSQSYMLIPLHFHAIISSLSLTCCDTSGSTRVNENAMGLALGRAGAGLGASLGVGLGMGSDSMAKAGGDTSKRPAATALASPANMAGCSCLTTLDTRIGLGVCTAGALAHTCLRWFKVRMLIC